MFVSLMLRIFASIFVLLAIKVDLRRRPPLLVEMHKTTRFTINSIGGVRSVQDHSMYSDRKHQFGAQCTLHEEPTSSRKRYKLEKRRVLLKSMGALASLYFVRGAELRS